MHSILSLIEKLVFLSLTIVLLQACYRMPTESDYSVIPTTNNPAVTNERTEGNNKFMPKVGY